MLTTDIQTIPVLMDEYLQSRTALRKRADRVLAVPMTEWLRLYTQRRKTEGTEPHLYEEYSELECILRDIPYPSYRNEQKDKLLQFYREMMDKHVAYVKQGIADDDLERAENSVCYLERWLNDSL